jgi:hypothetical protein
MGFEALMAVNIKITIFWDMTLYFGGWVRTFWGNPLPPSSGRLPRISHHSRVIYIFNGCFETGSS